MTKIDYESHKNPSPEIKFYWQNYHRETICAEPLPEKEILLRLRKLAWICKLGTLEGHQLSSIVWFLHDNILQHFQKTACYHFDEDAIKKENEELRKVIDKQAKTTNDLCSRINKMNWSVL